MNAQENERLLAIIDEGIRKGVAQALRAHKQAGRSIYVCRDGKVVEIPADEIPLALETDDPSSPE